MWPRSLTRLSRRVSAVKPYNNTNRVRTFADRASEPEQTVQKASATLSPLELAGKPLKSTERADNIAEHEYTTKPGWICNANHHERFFKATLHVSNSPTLLNMT